MSDLTTRLHPVGTSVVGLILLLVLVVLTRAPSDAPRPVNPVETGARTAADGQSTEPTAVLGGDSARQALDETAVGTPAGAQEPPLTDSCFRSGSSRDEVRAVMGAPDTVDFGAWVYGQSNVTFGYGVVLDYSNEGGNLRLC